MKSLKEILGSDQSKYMELKKFVIESYFIGFLSGCLVGIGVYSTIKTFGWL